MTFIFKQELSKKRQGDINRIEEENEKTIYALKETTKEKDYVIDEANSQIEKLKKAYDQLRQQTSDLS